MNLDVVINLDVVLIPGLTVEVGNALKTQEETFMTNEEMFLAVGLNGWKGYIERADKMFSGLSKEELLKEVAPGKNRLIYLWGHLTATHDAMLPLLGFGRRLHPEFDVAFISNPDKTQAGVPSVELVRKAWIEVNTSLFEGFASLSAADWLKKHGAVSEEDFLKEPLRNRFAILLSRTNHLAYHLGQTALRPK
jgi:DinB superfamily